MDIDKEWRKHEETIALVSIDTKIILNRDNWNKGS